MKKSLVLILALSLALLGGCALRTNPFAFSSEVYLEINGQEVTSPTEEALLEGLKNLDGSEKSYVYLEPGAPVDGMWYLSAALPLDGYEDGLGYILEACVESSVTEFAYYQFRTTDQEQVLSWFKDFYAGKSAPDTSGWEDISYWYYDYGDDYEYNDQGRYSGDSPVAI